MRIVDLYCGCGGLSLGFKKAGFELVAGFDNWKPAINIYEMNFTHPVHNIDLSDVEDYSIFNYYNPDMIIGGPPCQDFSSAGLRNEDNGRGHLTTAFAGIVYNVRPEWFVMENVDRILKTNKLRDTKEILKGTGYGLTSIVLNASYCNVPQSRKRYFLIGHLDSEDNFLNEILKKNLNKKKMTVYDYLGDSLGLEYYYRHPRSYARRGIFSIHEPSPTIRGVNRPIPKTYKPHHGDPIKISKNVRALTTLERSLIQTFPKSFKWEGTKTDLEQLIGNAVPVNLAKYVANCIIKYIQQLNTVSEINTQEKINF